MAAALEIDPSVSSSQDLKALILEIRDYARWFSQNAIKKRVAGSRLKTAEPELSPAARETLQHWSAAEPLSAKRFDALVATLEDYVERAPQVNITLAAPPTPGLKKLLVSWCRKNIAPNILVTFQFNATLLGGMVLRSGSHMFDWSFRRQILENRAKFPEVLRHV